MNDRRTELRLVLDVTGAAGDELIVMPIHLGKGGVDEGVEAMLKEAAAPAIEGERPEVAVHRRRLLLVDAYRFVVRPNPPCC